MLVSSGILYDPPQVDPTAGVRAGSDYVVLLDTSCDAGSGAVPLQPLSGSVGVAATLAQCEALCDENAECEAVSFTRHTQTETSCRLLKDVVPADCLTGAAAPTGVSLHLRYCARGRGLRDHPSCTCMHTAGKLCTYDHKAVGGGARNGGTSTILNWQEPNSPRWVSGWDTKPHFCFESELRPWSVYQYFMGRKHHI